MPGSHIVRPEEQRLYEAVGSSSGLVLLTGDAGCGKSVMLSGMIDRLEAAGERVLPLKADMMARGMASASVIDTLVSMLAPTVIVIDQIDALSQSMSADRSHLNDIMALIGRSALRQDRMCVWWCRAVILICPTTPRSVCLSAARGVRASVWGCCRPRMWRELCPRPAMGVLPKC